VFAHALSQLAHPLLVDQKAAAKGGFDPSIIILFGGMFAIYYFLLIRPQRKKEQERQGMLGALQKNDRVITQGGMIGLIASLSDTEVVLKVDQDKNIKIRFSRSAVVGRLDKKESKAEEKAEA
jgi:preprotein translocase subunit YajC